MNKLFSIARPRPPRDVDLVRAAVSAPAPEAALDDGVRRLDGRLLELRRAREEAVDDGAVALERQLAVALPEPAVHQHVLNVPDVSVQDHGRDRVDPPQHPGRAAVEDDQVRLGADADDAQVRAPEREAAVPGRHEEGLVDGHGVVDGDQPLLQGLVEHPGTGALQPDARLRQHIGRKGQEDVYAERGLVLDQMSVRVVNPAVHLRLGRDGDVLVGFSKKQGVRRIDTRRMGKNHGHICVQNTMAMEKLR